MEKLENNYYNSCENLSIYRFYEILKTGNHNILRLDSTDFNLEEYPTDGDDYAILTDVWNTIHESFVELMGKEDNSKAHSYILQMSELQLELSVVSTLAGIHQYRPLQILEIELKKWGYNPDDMESVLKQLKTVQFKMSMIKSRNSDIFDIPDEKEEDKFKYNLYKDVVLLEDSIGEGKNIDVNKTVVSMWVEYIKLAERKSNAIKKKNNG